MRKQWVAGLRVLIVNANSVGARLRLLAGWAANDESDVVLAQEHHLSSAAEIEVVALQVSKWGWCSAWTPAVQKNEGASAGTAVLWRTGLPVHGPVLQGGIARARGGTTMVTLKWPKMKEIKIMSVLS